MRHDRTAGKAMAADAAAGLIGDGATVALTGSGGGLIEADAMFAAVEQRFLRTGHPRDLTVVHALGIGDAKTRGLTRFSHPGMVRRVIGGHWTWSPAMQALAETDAIEAWTLPAGAIMLLLREIGAGRPGLITHVGLGTFADPLNGGGACSARAAAAAPIVERVEIGGRTLLRYLPFRVDVAIVRGSHADPAGNLSLVGEAADLDTVAAATAAHNSGGRVIAQVGRLVARGDIPARQVALPGICVDAIVVAPEQPQTYLGGYDADLSGETTGARTRRPPVAVPGGVRGIIARRAADEVRAGVSVNFGFGIPGAIPGILAERGLIDDVWVSVEQGIHNGELLDGEMFGAARRPDAIVASTRQFDFYSGGGIDIGFLGMGEVDAAGNVNVSRLGPRVVGPGGFVDIAQNAKKVVFCGTFDGKGTEYAFEPGRLVLRRAGTIAKLVPRVREITFAADYARAVGQEVVYVTERAVFRLCAEGLELTELAPGLDLQADVLDRIAFTPLVRGMPAALPAAHFAV